IGNTDNVISPEFKCPASNVCFIAPKKKADGTLDTQSYLETLDLVEKLIKEKKVLSAWTPTYGGIAEGIFKMAIGSNVGFKMSNSFDEKRLYGYNYGAFILEMADETIVGEILGETIGKAELRIGSETLQLKDLLNVYENKLESVFPYHSVENTDEVQTFNFTSVQRATPKIGIAKPKVLIPVFPGTNCEYDTARALIRAGAEPDIMVIKNLSGADIEQSIATMVSKIEASQMIVIPGGFSGGDEPEGSGKFITAFFRNPNVAQAVNEMLKNRDGLMCGICNGFQALIKLGLVPYGEIVDTDENSPTLTFNTIGRHQSMLVRTRVCSNISPWLSRSKVGDIHTVAISHGEGRFVAPEALIEKLAQNGQIATQYVDLKGNPTMDVRFNPNTGMQAIEGITSPDGRVFGKMAHSERYADNLYKNIDGNKDQQIFDGAVDYFKI
ncbi:MAG: phosphoribosylformylglycinamidine synthase subunit PurQ, partial [Oscillospiraceae bacterium]